MPQSKQRKREYNRERQRRLRGYRGGGESERGVVPTDVVPVHNKRADVVPQLSRQAIYDAARLRILESQPNEDWAPRLGIERKTSRWLHDYEQYLAKRGYGLAKTSRGYELVSLVTGQLGQEGTGLASEFYTQAPAVHVLKEAPGTPLERTVALEERVLRLETDQVLREALDDRTGLG